MRRRRRVDPRLQEQRADMPIIDSARMPLEDAPGDSPRPWFDVWLRFVRPAVLALCWLAAGYYVWRYVFGDGSELPLLHQLAIYAAIVVLILILMLALVGRRRVEVDEEQSSAFDESTLHAMSDLANVDPEELQVWQQAQRLVVHHDEHGAMLSATQHEPGPAPAPPGPAAAPPTRG